MYSPCQRFIYDFVDDLGGLHGFCGSLHIDQTGTSSTGNRPITRSPVSATWSTVSITANLWRRKGRNRRRLVGYTRARVEEPHQQSSLMRHLVLNVEAKRGMSLCELQ